MIARPKIAVVGLGTMGSMTLWRLATRGVAVDGFEQYGIGHDFGAAGGGTRMFRMVYAEGARYHPLLAASRLLWRRLERETDSDLLVRNGCLTLGSADGVAVVRSLEMARATGLAHELMDAATVRGLYPGYALTDDEVGVFDPEGGVLRSNGAVVAAVRAATRLGAVVRTGATVGAVEPDETGVTVEVGGERHRYDAVVVATGPWQNPVLARLGYAPEPRRARTSFHRPKDRRLVHPQHSPSALRRLPDGRSYGLMSALDGETVKVVIQAGDATVPVPVEQVFEDTHNEAYVAEVVDLVSDALPGLDPYPVALGAHPEGFTPDSEGMVGHVPGSDRVVLLSGFSGHGFKFAPGIGEVAAALAVGETVQIPATLDPARFAGGTAPKGDAELANLWFDNRPSTP